MLGELLAKPGVTEICELRGRFGMMALHGGNLERTTDVVAAEVARRTDASFYGVIQAPPIREHLTSTAFDPAASDALASFLSFVDVALRSTAMGEKINGTICWWGEAIATSRVTSQNIFEWGYLSATA